MEYVCAAAVLDSAIVGWLSTRTLETKVEIEDQKILALFNEMKERMGLQDHNIDLVASQVVATGCATGRTYLGGKAEVVINEVVIEDYSDADLMALFAHELSHIKHHDSLRTTLFFATVHLATAIALMTLLSLPPVAAFAASLALALTLMYFVFLPIVEYQADRSAAENLNDVELRHYIEHNQKELEKALELREEKGCLSYERITYDSSGNIRTDFTHPRRTTVIAMLERVASERLSKVPAAG